LLQVYGEAACPDTRDFVLGPLSQVVDAFGPLGDLAPIALFYIPFGNAYYLRPCPGGVPAPPDCHDSASCLYNATVRQCFDDTCGNGTEATRPPTCFIGQPTCQHGRVECFTNRVQSCAMLPKPHPGHQIDTTPDYFGFFACYFAAFGNGTLAAGISTDDEILEVGAACAGRPPPQNVTRVDWAAVKACAKSTIGDLSVASAAAFTPPHPGTPFALLEGEAVDTAASGAALVQAICDRLEEKDKYPACQKGAAVVEAVAEAAH